MWPALPLLALLFAEPDLESLFSNAERALRANELVEAERGFRQFLKHRPDHLAALGNLGVVYSRTGRYHEAISMYERALKLAPKSPDLNLNLGLAWLKQDDHRAARVCFERAAAIRPDHAQTKELLATTQLFTADVDSAVSTLESLPPTPGVQYLLSVGYLKQGRREEARGSINRLFAGVSKAQAHLLAGRAYYESTLFEEAVRELRQARDLDSALPGVWRELGKAEISLRQSEDARVSLREAVRREPADAEALYFLGALLVQEGSVKEGVPLLERSRESRPAFWGSWYYLGKAALASGEPARAAELLRRADELHPDEMPVLYQLARALKASGRDAESRQTMQKYNALQKKGRRQAEDAVLIR